MCSDSAVFVRLEQRAYSLLLQLFLNLNNIVSRDSRRKEDREGNNMWKGVKERGKVQLFLHKAV